MIPTMLIQLLVVVSCCKSCDAFTAANLVKEYVQRVSRLRVLHVNQIDVTDFIHSEISASDVVKNGVVLLAQPSEYNHFLIKAAVLVFDYGSGRGSRGVILERATAFTMGETSPNCGNFVDNTLYLGGEDGSDKAIMFHKYELDGYSKYIGAGIYTGGLGKAQKLIENNEAQPKDFKFVFNSVEWGPDQLEAEIKAGRWDVANVPPDLILQQSSSKASLWSKARNKLRFSGGLTGGDAQLKLEDGEVEIDEGEEDENSYPV